jgi:hypothetical protein
MMLTGRQADVVLQCLLDALQKTSWRTLGGRGAFAVELSRCCGSCLQLCWGVPLCCDIHMPWLSAAVLTTTGRHVHAYAVLACLLIAAEISQTHFLQLAQRCTVCVQVRCIVATLPALQGCCVDHLRLQQLHQGLFGDWVCSTSVSAVQPTRLCTRTTC